MNLLFQGKSYRAAFHLTHILYGTLQIIKLQYEKFFLKLGISLKIYKPNNFISSRYMDDPWGDSPSVTSKHHTCQTHNILWQYKLNILNQSNETPTWCNTVQVLFLQSHLHSVASSWCFIWLILWCTETQN